VLDRAASADRRIGCGARLKGGWDRGGGQAASFGVQLALGSPDEVAAALDHAVAESTAVTAEA